jgi:RNA polymerase sigma-70 factor (ECF subfamily)
VVDQGLEASSSGDVNDAYARFFRAHVPAVRGFVRTRVVDSEVESVVSATFVTAWQRFADVPQQAPVPWLFGVARNHILNHVRSGRRRAALVDVLNDQRPQESAPADGVHDRDQLRAALARLSDTDREIIQLSVWHELQPAEIAEVLGLQPEAARVRLHRARQRMVALLESEGGER